MEQIAQAVLMVRPAAFGFNEETASSNVWQKRNTELPASQIVDRARREFDRFARELTDSGVRVIIIDDTPEPRTPDAVFPNNWVSFQDDGTAIVYPMLSSLRRREYRTDIFDIVRSHGFRLDRVIDLRAHEEAGRFLEGTGAIVFDYVRRIAYANRSSRMHEAVLRELCERTGFAPFPFTARAEDGREIYHTNVMMTIGAQFVVICPDAIDREDRRHVLQSLRESDREVIEISHSQMGGFAANILEVGTQDGSVIAMSRQAFRSFTPDQMRRLQRHAPVVSASLELIEGIEGGSARCMLAAIHLPSALT